MTRKIMLASFLIHCLFTVLCATGVNALKAQSKDEKAFDNANFKATFSDKGITSFFSKQDKYAANII